MHRNDAMVVVGGVILEVHPEASFAVDVELLSSIASALHESVVEGREARSEGLSDAGRIAN